MIGVLVMMTVLLIAQAAEETKFTADQCKVMKQMGINTDGICDHIFGAPKKDRVVKKPKR